MSSDRVSNTTVWVSSCTIPGPPDALSGVLDAIAAKQGTAAIGYKNEGLRQARAWSMTRRYLSPEFTTDWRQLLVVL